MNQISKKEKRRQASYGVRLGAALVEILGSGPEGDEKREEQARLLGIMWSSAQGSLLGAMIEVVNLKYHDDVRWDPEEHPGRATPGEIIQRRVEQS